MVRKNIIWVLTFCSVLFLSISPTYAWLSGWNYRQAINISNTAGDLTNYQIRVDLNSTNVGANFNWSNNGSDIRFTSSTDDELNYWIENWDSTNQEATIWVNVTSIPNNTNTTIYMYYGNPSASSESNGDAVFEFFDDFEGASLDTSKWNEVWTGGSYSVSDSILTVTGGATWEGIGAKTQFSPPVIFEYYAKMDDVSKCSIRADDRSATGTCQGTGEDSFAWAFYTSRRYRTVRENTPTDVTRTTDLSAKYYRLTAKWTSSFVAFYEDGVLKQNTTTNVPLDNLGAQFEAYYSTTNVFVDWVAVRKYADPEPTVSGFGNEEILVGVIISVYDNQTNESLTNWQVTFTNGTNTTTFYNLTNPTSFYYSSLPQGENNITISDGSDTKYYYNYTFTRIINSTNLWDETVYLEPKGNNTVTLSASPSWSILEGQQVQITCTALEGTPKLYMDNVEISNPYTLTTQSGTYTVVCNVTETTNYRPAEKSNTLAVNPLISCTNNLTFAFSTEISTTTNITSVNFTKFVDQYFVKPDLSDVYVPNVSNVWKNTADGYYIVVNNTGLSNFTVYFGNYYANYSYSDHAVSNIHNIDSYTQENTYVVYQLLDEVAGQKMHPPNATVLSYVSCSQGSNYIPIYGNDTQFLIALTSYPEKVSVRVQYSADSYYSRSLYPDQANQYLLSFYLVDAYQYPLDRIDFVMQDSNYYNSRLQIYKTISNQTIIITEGYFDASHTLSQYLMEDTDYYLRTLNTDGTYTEFGRISVVEPTTKTLGQQTINLNPQSVLISNNILMNAYKQEDTLYVTYQDKLNQTEQVNITIYFSNGTVFKNESYSNQNSLNLNYDISNYTNESFWVDFEVEHQQLGNSPVSYGMMVGSSVFWDLGISSTWYSLFAMALLLFIGGLTTRTSVIGGTILFISSLIIFRVIGWLSLSYVFIGLAVFLGLLGIIIYVKQGGE